MNSSKDVNARLVVKDLSKRLRAAERKILLLERRGKRDAKILLEIRNEKRLEIKISRKEKAKLQSDAFLAYFLIFALSSLSITATIVYSQRPGDDKKAAFEFASYAIPATAALIAGMTALVKRAEIKWFWTSTTLVLAGVIIFILNEGVTATLIWDLLITYGIIAAFYVVPLNLLKAYQQKRRVSKKGWAAIVGSTACFILGMWAIRTSYRSAPLWFAEIVGHRDVAGAPKRSQLKCVVGFEDKTERTETLLCTSKK